jgi:predicted 3-demethylubiquinone-9 3-methyltransferase (glyoxalase superfamily)
MLKIHPFLWFDDEAEEAMRFYCSIFPNSKVNKVSVMPEANGEPGHIMTVECELDGLSVTALNAGPGDPFNTSMSLYVETKDQAETDHYWNALLAGVAFPSLAAGWSTSSGSIGRSRRGPC